MDVRTRPVYTATEFSELTGIPVAAALEVAGRPHPDQRVFSWADALRKLAEEISLSSFASSSNGKGSVAKLFPFPLPPTKVMEEAERILRRGGRAYLDLYKSLKHISVDPNRLSGLPEISGTRVHAIFVGMEAKQPDGHNTLMRGYDLTPEQIEDAVNWSEKALSYATA